MKEPTVKFKLMQALRSLDPVPFFYMTGAGSYQQSGLPDFVGCHNSRFFAVETKTTGEKLRPDQEFKINQIKKRGGIAEVIDSQESIDQFINLLKSL